MAIRHHAVVWFVHVIPLVDVEPTSNVDAPAVALRHQPSSPDRHILDQAAAIATSRGEASPPAADEEE